MVVEHRKDKTMVHILDTLTRLENKFDNLALVTGSHSSTSTPETTVTPGHPASTSTSSSSRAHKSRHSTGTPRFPTELQQGYQHLTVPHKIILWPSIYIHLINSGISAASDLQHVLQEGTPWFIRQEMRSHRDLLSTEPGLQSYYIQGYSPGQSHPPRVGFHALTSTRIHEYCDAYFNTFNILAPVLNRDTFVSETLSHVVQYGFAEDVGSVLALVVLALGQVASEGVFEQPISAVNGIASGFRGGTLDRPPGLEIFNEARRRVGFIATQMSLENVQIMLLQGTYHEATANHLDFWRATVTASMACQVLIKCQTIDWQSHYGDLLKRAYWTCVLSEDLFHLDLDLPQSGIQTFEDIVPLPYFIEGQDMHTPGFPVQAVGVQTAEDRDRSHFQYHFLAMIALRRLISRIHEVIHECKSSRHSRFIVLICAHTPYLASTTQPESSDGYGGPPLTVIREMSRQLESWRSLLPRPLQWQDNEKLEFPNIDVGSRRPNEPLFSPDQGPVPIGHKYNLDLVTAQLRTRFYYARFMMYRPFVYKALHFPELMDAEDEYCCGVAIKAALLWPIALAPPKNKKRLVPHLYAWTQNFLGILLILRMTTENECLRQICEEHVDRDDIHKTVALMLEWFRDVRQVDGIAEWSWQILDPLYSVHNGQEYE